MQPVSLPVNQTNQYNYPQVGFPKKTISLPATVLQAANVESQIFRVFNPGNSTAKVWFYQSTKDGDVGISIPPLAVEYFAVFSDTKIESDSLIEITWLL